MLLLAPYNCKDTLQHSTLTYVKSIDMFSQILNGFYMECRRLSRL